MVCIAKICQQILFTPENFRWLSEESIGRRHKNLSVTINELLRNYQYMIRAVDKANKETEEKQKQRELLIKKAENYKNQILNAIPEVK